ncbi:unnamed protein product, partial [Prorocentrum cordatum]
VDATISAEIECVGGLLDSLLAGAGSARGGHCQGQLAPTPDPGRAPRAERCVLEASPNGARQGQPAPTPGHGRAPRAELYALEAAPNGAHQDAALLARRCLDLERDLADAREEAERLRSACLALEEESRLLGADLQRHRLEDELYIAQELELRRVRGEVQEMHARVAALHCELERATAAGAPSAALGEPAREAPETSEALELCRLLEEETAALPRCREGMAELRVAPGENMNCQPVQASERRAAELELACGAGAASAGPAEPGHARQDREDEKPRQPALFHKTKMCKFNQLGMCTRGEMCRFAHGRLDMNPLPDLSQTKLCKELLGTGQCSDPSCKFAHTRQELRRHPFVPAGGRDHAGPLSGVRKQPRGAAALEAAPGHEGAQLQDNANLLCSDLAKVLHKMKETGQAGSPALYAELAHIFKGFHDSDLVDAWMQQGQATGAYGSPELNSIAGGCGEQSVAATWAHNCQNLPSAAYVSPSRYHGRGGAAATEHLAGSAARHQQSYDEARLGERTAPPGRAAAAARRGAVEPKLLSPMYAPAMSSLDSLAPFALA